MSLEKGCPPSINTYGSTSLSALFPSHNAHELSPSVERELHFEVPPVGDRRGELPPVLALAAVPLELGLLYYAAARINPYPSFLVYSIYISRMSTVNYPL